MPQHNAPGLYGITEENSSRYGQELWGKNQFNSTFPLSLCLYMRDKGIDPVSVKLENGETIAKESQWEMSDIIGKTNNNIRYHFEKSFDPYIDYSRNEGDKIDLVISCDGVDTIPLEVKLTVVPDSTTCNGPEPNWAPEIVIRPVSSAHAMMGVAKSLLLPSNTTLKNAVVKALRPAYNLIKSWDNLTEVSSHAEEIHKSLKRVLMMTEDIQKPFLLQPIWRTKGQSLELCEQCFDVFVWSDVALMHIPVQECSKEPAQGRNMTRMLREVARHVRSLYDIMQTGDYDYSDVYKGMSLGLQTDKSFAISGKRTFNYLKHHRLEKPVLPRSVLYNLILKGGESVLKPERRFDAAVQAHMTSRSPDK